MKTTNLVGQLKRRTETDLGFVAVGDAFIGDAETKRRRHRRRREDRVRSNAEDRSVRDLHVEGGAETVDQQAPGVDLHAQGVAKRVQLAERHLVKIIIQK